MRIYRERIQSIARDTVKALMSAELIEVEPDFVAEVELDVESVLKEYRRTDYELTEKARDLVAARGLDYSHTFKLKNRLASERKFALGDEAIQWIADQIVEILLQSRNVEEIYGEDHDLRGAIAPVLKRELNVDRDLDREVKRRIKNFQEGTGDYDVEYKRALEQVRATKNLED
ncbi:MAG: hypothetical protein ACI9MR_004237 [Myxococcota bacterium]|jgi:hypothetical protein